MTSPASAILAAAHFAADKHRDQRRKGPEKSPYINHPIAVAEILASIGNVADLEIIQAALLHDTVEDTETSPAEIEQAFGKRVASLVAEVTDDKDLEKAERKRLQVEHAAHLSRGAKLVKLADKICNVRDIAESPPEGWSVERRTEYFDWAEKVVAGCRDVDSALAAYFDALLKRARERLKRNPR